MKKVILLIIFVFSFAPLNSYALMRCGNKLIQMGDSKGVIILKCGKPYYKAAGGIQLKIHTDTHVTRKNTGKYTIHTKSQQNEDIIEIWYYKTGYGKFIRILTFRNERLETIASGPRQK